MVDAGAEITVTVLRDLLKMGFSFETLGFYDREWKAGDTNGLASFYADPIHTCTTRCTYKYSQFLNS
jgi:hypothetical protein